MLTQITSETTSEPVFIVDNTDIEDADLPEFKDMPFENINELQLDHPGANDPAYRERRDYIASLSKRFRETGIITDVDYTEEEQAIWRHVAGRLEEVQARRAYKFYL